MVKPSDDFYSDKSKVDGLSTYCRECRKNKTRGWYRANPEKAKESAAEWRAANPERYREHQRKWQREHPKERAELSNRRRVRLAGNGPIEKIDPWFIYERDGGKCHICGKRVATKDMSLDHLVPVSKGGAHMATNLRLAHRVCNVRRGPGRMDTQLLLT